MVKDGCVSPSDILFVSCLSPGNFVRAEMKSRCGLLDCAERLLGKLRCPTHVRRTARLARSHPTGGLNGHSPLCPNLPWMKYPSWGEVHGEPIGQTFGADGFQGRSCVDEQITSVVRCRKVDVFQRRLQARNSSVVVFGLLVSGQESC